MLTLVHELGELFLKAVPVAVVVVILYFFLRSLFFKPILKIMTEREARTRGAQKSADAALAAAAEKLRQYQEALRQAKVKIYAEQEAERKKLLDGRAAALKDARAKSSANVASAKQRIAAELEAAKKEVEETSSQLAVDIANRALQLVPEPTSPLRELR
jgi:F-type H+-transporting ATPase subunit b